MRRRLNPQQRRHELCDAAVDVLGNSGARGLTHLEVDRRAGLPAGTASAYYRTREALLHAIAARITELDLADLGRMTEKASADVGATPGIAELASVVMMAARDPWLTRTRARFELALQAGRDPVLGEILQQTNSRFTALARQAVKGWQDPGRPKDDVLIDDQTVAALTFVDGVMMGFVRGVSTFHDQHHLARVLHEIIEGAGRLNAANDAEHRGQRRPR
ncbi:MAG: TetR family transcriptional regulator [Mycobacterium sp.]|uniref:TetR/AcrR family transcriptional regulator n=1 Tax=Mycobacterium sp. TaxID=1785 RepID=UPI003BB6C9BB